MKTSNIIALLFAVAAAFIMIACIFIDPEGQIHTSIPESVKYMIFASLSIILSGKDFGLAETVKILMEQWFKIKKPRK